MEFRASEPRIALSDNSLFEMNLCQLLGFTQRRNSKTLLMKKTYAIGLSMLLIGGFSLIEANSSGSPAGHSGSPASNGNTCARSGCHSGGGSPGAQHIVNVSSDIPASGYIAGDTYTITISVDDANDAASRSGIAVSMEDGSGTHLGTLATGSGTRFSSGSSNFITHQSSSIGLPLAGRDYSFQWTAPAAGSGQVTLYAAVNFANGNGTTSGDIIKEVTEVFSEASSVGLDESSRLSLSLFPNPTSGLFRLSALPSNVTHWSISDLQGKTVNSGKLIPGSTQEMDLRNAPAGLYFVHVYGNDGLISSSRIVKE